MSETGKRFWVVYKPGRRMGWPQSFPTRQIAEDFIYENGWEDFMHTIESSGQTAVTHPDTSGS